MFLNVYLCELFTEVQRGHVKKNKSTCVEITTYLSHDPNIKKSCFF